MTPPRPAHAYRWMIAAAFLAAVAVRFGGLTRESLWLDEGWTLRLSAGGPGDVVRACAQDVHPPLYFLLFAAWTKALGTSDVAMRALSAVLGVLAVVATAGMARRLVGPRAALVATWIAALSPLLVRYAQDARPYALLVVLATTSSWAFAAYAHAPSRTRWLVWLVPSVLLPWTHVLGASTLLAQAVCVALVRGRGGRSRYAPVLPVLGGLALVALAFLPWIGRALDANERWAGYEGATAVEAWRALVQVVGTRGGLGVLLLAAAWGGVSRAGLRSPRIRRPRLAVAGLLAAIPFAVPLAATWTGRSVFAPRLAIASVPPFAALLAAGLVAAWFQARGARARRGLPLLAGLVALVVVPGLLQAVRRVDNEDWRGAAAELAARAAPDDLVLADGDVPALLLRHYLPGDRPVVEPFDLSRPSFPPAATAGRRLWVVSSQHTTEAEPKRLRLLRQHWNVDTARVLHGTVVRLYRR